MLFIIGIITNIVLIIMIRIKILTEIMYVSEIDFTVVAGIRESVIIVKYLQIQFLIFFFLIL